MNDKQKGSYRKEVAHQNLRSTQQIFSSHLVLITIRNFGGLWARPLGWGRGWPLINMLLLHLCYHAKFGHSRSKHTIVIRDTRQKKWLLASRLSRSLKVIVTDTDRSATYDFLLVIHINRGPISYRFHDKQRFRPKIAFFPNHRVLNAPTKGVSIINFVTTFGFKN